MYPEDSSNINNLPHDILTEQGKQHIESPSEVNNKGPVLQKTIKHNGKTSSVALVRKLKDQLIQAKVYLSLPISHGRELQLRVKEVSRTLGDASKDSDLPRK